MALLITKKCINCDICKPECPNEMIPMDDSICEINSDKCTECVGHYDTPTCQRVCPIPGTVLKGPAYVETKEQLRDEFVLMHRANKFQPRRHLAMKLLPCPYNKHIARRPDKTLRVTIR